MIDSDDLDLAARFLSGVEFDFVGYYNDGEPGTADPAHLAELFPGKTLVSICRKRGVKAVFIDVESGAATVEDAVAAIQAGDVQGAYGGVELDGQPGSLDLIAQALPGVPWTRWAARWGAMGLWPETQLTQFESPSTGVPGHYDRSFVADGWEPSSHPPENPDMPQHPFLLFQ